MVRSISSRGGPMKRSLRLFLLFLSFCILLAACGSSTTTSNSITPTPAPVTLNVNAAASLTESFTEIGTAYQQQHSNVTVKFNFNGSQILEQQIANGVPAGKYARQALANLSQSTDYGSSFTNEVLANVVSEEQNVKAVVQKVQLGEADAGFVYVTDVTSAVADKVKIIDI